jgi:hypothetical protein
MPSHPTPSFPLQDPLHQIGAALTSRTSNANALPAPSQIATAAAKIYSALPERGLGDAATLGHILDDLAPGFNGSKTSSNYYGFVTGGVLPVAEAADVVVGRWDQNVQVSVGWRMVG